MSDLVIAGNTSGTVTLSAPAVAGSTVLTLPTSSGTLITEGMTLLGTLTTTSGTTQTLSGLDLTSYSMVFIFINRVSHNGATTRNLRILASDGTTQMTLMVTAIAATDFYYGMLQISLNSGLINVNIGATSSAAPTFQSGATSDSRIGNGGWSNSTTSFTFSFNSDSFDAGTIVIYGVK